LKRQKLYQVEAENESVAKDTLEGYTGRDHSILITVKTGIKRIEYLNFDGIEVKYE